MTKLCIFLYTKFLYSFPLYRGYLWQPIKSFFFFSFLSLTLLYNFTHALPSSPSKIFFLVESCFRRKKRIEFSSSFAVLQPHVSFSDGEFYFHLCFSVNMIRSELLLVLHFQIYTRTVPCAAFIFMIEWKKIEPLPRMTRRLLAQSVIL